tara:strand:+ start:1022 stop:1258 length:237 start_codon:yes stop_codon:yes gene_type:complete
MSTKEHDLNHLPLFQVGQIVESRINQGELSIGKPYEIIKVTKHDGNVFYWVRHIDFKDIKVTKSVPTIIAEKDLRTKE